MQLSNAIRKRIIELCIKGNITLHQLSLRAGISYSTLNSFINGKTKSPKVVTILHICEGLGIELKDFFDDNIFKDVIDE